MTRRYTVDRGTVTVIIESDSDVTLYTDNPDDPHQFQPVTAPRDMPQHFVSVDLDVEDLRQLLAAAEGVA